MDNWYEKIAKSGWLGTKAQVSATYGNPVWSSKDQSGDKPNDAMTEAIKNLAKKSKVDGDTGA